MSQSADLLAPLEPPREDVERLVGTLDGPIEGLGAGLRVWCGPAIGWRDLGEFTTTVGVVVRHRGMLRLGISFNLGPAPKIVAADSLDGAGA